MSRFKDVQISVLRERKKDRLTKCTERETEDGSTRNEKEKGKRNVEVET